MFRQIWMSIKIRLFVGPRVSLGENFHIGLMSIISSPDELKIGDNVYVGKNCSIQCSGSIGSSVLIANNVGVVGRFDHDFRQVGVAIRFAREVSKDPVMAKHPRNYVEIGDDVWIGFGSVILSGIKIGRGSIIAAGSVVKSDVPPYAIYAGNPAIEVARRFTDVEIPAHEHALYMEK